MPASHRGAAAADFVPAAFFRGRVFSNPLGLGSHFDHAAGTAACPATGSLRGTGRVQTVS
jgi:hypothetical protein